TLGNFTPRSHCFDGCGQMRRRALVITPSVPSLPTRSWVRSGPALGPSSVRRMAPVPSTASSERTMSAIFPYLLESCPALRAASSRATSPRGQPARTRPRRSTPEDRAPAPCRARSSPAAARSCAHLVHLDELFAGEGEDLEQRDRARAHVLAGAAGAALVEQG